MVQVAYDYNPAPIQGNLVQPINFSPGLGTGPQSSPLGQLSPLGGPPDLEQWRVFCTKQKCMAFQVSIQEVYDPSFGIPAGEGLTLSGLNFILGLKSKWRTVPSAISVGGS
jgi:hypothetical protein